MAKLQRKKASTGRKKKKQKDAAEMSDGPKNDAAPNKLSLVQSVSGSVKKTQPPMPAKAARGEPGKIRAYWDKSIQFLREVRVELKKVTWPSRKQTIGSTVVVLILVMVISIFLGVADIGLSSLIRVVLQ